ncbi:beta-L-arabinofuranosidase domain-containing protein [Bifidobacterium sp. SO1]|uniref:beta-L-arabinofuranosidase domain-containing protein n=1 Tax=Bifidobacterium sp. SO1 TaxID=2809029 RepID=UPI001BDD4041|nr:beta-L-arabinofuranosidase domain-containing protein [Bifidobacterium sp. SO1]MBT1160807.1 glycoside hydrolase family 127 protein [Bifidobacterium sp. SO1]
MSIKTYEAFPIDQVTLLDGEFLRRQELVKRYVLGFDVDRLMHTFRINAGLASEAIPLGGWEAPDCGLRGHFVGHFLSAASRFCVDGNNSARERELLHGKVDGIVAVMKQCAHEDGYLSAFPESDLERLEEQEFQGVWAPYYTLHKIMQGLVDASRYAGNGDALDLAVGLAHYIGRRFDRLGFWKIDNILHPTRLNPVNEYGGIGDVLYTLYTMAGDESILHTAELFDREYFAGNLANGHDVLEDLHANTHLPMVMAMMRRYEITGETRYRDAAEHFYRFLRTRTFANGSNSSKATHYSVSGVSSKAEHWGAAGDLHDALTGGESESCNGHNTESIVSALFSWNGDPDLLAHLARLKFDAVLNCMSPSTGLSQYHQPMGGAVYKVFSTPDDSFWCCTGTGVEGGSDLQKDIWFKGVDSDDIVLSSFIASRLNWRERGLTFDLRTVYPMSLSADIEVHEESAQTMPRHARLLLRADMVRSVTVLDRNGDPAASSIEYDHGFISVMRVFRDGDVIRIGLREALRGEPLAGDPSRISLLCGDVLLAGLGTAIGIGPLPPEDLDGRCRRVMPDESSRTRRNNSNVLYTLSTGSGPVDLVPLYAVGAKQRYTVYFSTAAEPVVEQEFKPVAEGAN